MNYLSEPLVDTILERLRHDNWTQAAIAEDLGLKPHTVARVARIHGLQRRQVGTEAVRDHARRKRRSDMAWMDEAACKNVVDNTGEPFVEWRVDRQQRVCVECPVRKQCLNYGLTGPIWVGPKATGTVYGGLDPRDLIRLRRIAAGET